MSMEDDIKLRLFIRFNDSLSHELQWKGGDRFAFFKWRKAMLDMGYKPPYVDVDMVYYMGQKKTVDVVKKETKEIKEIKEVVIEKPKSEEYNILMELKKELGY